MAEKTFQFPQAIIAHIEDDGKYLPMDRAHGLDPEKSVREHGNILRPIPIYVDSVDANGVQRVAALPNWTLEVVSNEFPIGIRDVASRYDIHYFRPREARASSWRCWRY